MRRFLILVIVSIIFSSLSYAAVFDSLGGLRYNDELDDAYGIEVYGTHEDVPDNDFKRVEGGYYTWLGESGEYRFHGFDRTFNPYSNRWFPDDASGTVRLENKDWLARGWETAGYRADVFQRFIQTTTDEQARCFLKEAYRQMLPFPMWQSASADECLYIQTFPTIVKPGEGVMWHRRGETVWYQTFSLDRLEDKMPTDLLLKLDEWTLSPYDFDSGSQTLRLELSSRLLDDAFFRDPVEGRIRYQRDDVDHFRIEINGEAYEVLPDEGPGSVSASFLLAVGAHAREVGKMDLRISACAVYLNGRQSATRTLQKEIDLSGMEDLLSRFNTSNIVTQDEIGLADIAYHDMSRGFYEEAMLSFTSGSFKAEYVFGQAIDPQVVREGLLAFIQSNGLGAKAEIAIVQTLRRGERESVHTERIGIVPLEEGVDLDFELPESVFDIQRIKAVNRTAMDRIAKREVRLDGQPVSFSRFFSGQYRLGKRDEDRLVEVVITLVTTGGMEYRYTDFIECLTTRVRPNFSQTVKAVEGRPVHFSDLLESCNREELLQAYPVDYDVETSGILERDAEGFSVAFDSPGIQTLRITLDNGVRTSRVNLAVVVHEDLEPAVVVNLDDNQIYRGERLHAHIDCYSPDGDPLVSEQVHIEEDLDLDGIYEKRVPYDAHRVYGALGNYRLVASASEGGVETKVIREFRVENHRPITTLSFVENLSPPKADLVLVIPGSLDEPERAAAEIERDLLQDELIKRGYDAGVTVYFEQPRILEREVAVTCRTGAVEPAATLVYEEEGYEGTLDLVETENWGHYEDQGHYVTKRRCRDVPIYEHIRSCSICGTYINAIGYRMCKFCKVVTGTTRECTTRHVWVPDIVWIDDFVGHYAGTATRTVTVPYEDPFRSEARKVMLVRGEGPAALEPWLDKAEEVMLEQPGWMDALFPIAKQYPRTILVEEPFSLLGGECDLEGDPMGDSRYRITQSAGEMESVEIGYSHQGIWQSEVPDRFVLPGYYEIEKEISDRVEPEVLSMPSNLARVVLKVHRPPVADFRIEQDDILRFLDFSYDPDYRTTRPDAGIVEKHLCLTDESGQKLYSLPEALLPGTYTVEWTVVDGDGAFASVVKPVVITEAAAAIGGTLSPETITVTQQVVLDELRVEGEGPAWVLIDLMRGNEKLRALRQTHVSLKTEGRDLPSVKTTLSKDRWDGDYGFRVQLVSDRTQDLLAERYFPFEVVSPLRLEVVDLGRVAAGEEVMAMASTADYVEDVALVSAGGEWPMIRADGLWRGVFTATGQPVSVRASLNNRTEQAAVPYHLSPLGDDSALTIRGEYSYWHGQVNLFGQHLPDMPDRLMAYEKAVIVLNAGQGEEEVILTFDERLGQEPIPMRFTGEDYRAEWTIPLVPSTLDSSGKRLMDPYGLSVTLAGRTLDTRFEVTGNVYDRIHLQPLR